MTGRSLIFVAFEPSTADLLSEALPQYVATYDLAYQPAPTEEARP